jgi:Fic family protein
VVATLDPIRITTLSIPPGTGWLLGECMECRGRQDLWIRQRPDMLEVLREQAIIQSVESSNRIEGVEVSPERLRPIVEGKSRPRDRSEEELTGYRRALHWIFKRSGPIDLTPALILRLHALAQGGAIGDAGTWKRRDNEIVEILPDGERRVRLIPTSARETPKAIEVLCRDYRKVREEGRFPLLLLIGTFVFDLLCIHPFRDGNGRVSRLATTLLLETEGFILPRFISLERLVEESREEYYRVLAECSAGWHEGNNFIIPWWNFFLSHIRRGYREFESRIESAGAGPAKSDLVRRSILDQAGPFTLSDLKALLPAVSSQLIKKVLSAMRQEGQVRLEGRGRGARWQRMG